MPMIIGLAMNTGDCFHIGILLLIGVWLCFVAKAHRMARKPGLIDIQRVETYRYIAKKLRHWGWAGVLALAVLLIFMFPTVTVVTYTPDARYVKHTAYSYSRATDYTDTVYIEKFYVPFLYGGRFCAPFCSYVYNDIEDTLMLYQTHYIAQRYTSVDPGPEILPGQRLSFNHKIPYYYCRPYQSSDVRVIYGTKIKRKSVWTLTSRQSAIEDMRYINNEINAPFRPFGQYKY